MKASVDAILRPEQAEYLERLHPANEGVVAEMERYATARRVPIADREVARFLEITARAINARRVLEIGMAIGYSTLHLARAVAQGGPGGEVVAVEPDEERIAVAEDFLDKASLRALVRVERGRAQEVMPRLARGFDLVFIDALKEEYVEYLEAALPLLRKGGVVVADNLLWGGQVAGEPRDLSHLASTTALRDFNRRFTRHPGLLAQVLPVGDGLGYAIKLD